MKSFKTLVVIVAILIVANCVLMGMLWYNNYHRNNNKTVRPPVQIKGPAFEYLSRELKLTPGQVKKYEALRKQHQELTQKVSGEQRMMRDSFFDNLKKPDSKPAEVELLEKRILIAQNKLDTATYYHFRRLRGILNPGQQQKFDTIINHVLHMMAQPHPQGGGPGGQPGQMGPNGKPMDGPHQGRPDWKPGKHKPGPDSRPMEGPPNGGPPDGRPGGPPPDGRPWPPPPGSHPPPGNGPPPQGPPPGGGPPPQHGPPPPEQ
jgi:hypothetical protein